MSRLYQIPRKLLQRLMDSEEFAEQIAYDQLLSRGPERPQITADFVKSEVQQRQERHEQERGRRIGLNR